MHCISGNDEGSRGKIVQIVIIFIDYDLRQQHISKIDDLVWHVFGFLFSDEVLDRKVLRYEDIPMLFGDAVKEALLS